MGQDQLLDPEAAGAYLGGTKPLKKGTLARHRCYGSGPAFIRLHNRTIRYRLSDLDAWLARGLKAGSTSEYPDAGDPRPKKQAVAA